MTRRSAVFIFPPIWGNTEKRNRGVIITETTFQGEGKGFSWFALKERERAERKWGGARNCIPVLKVPRQCPLVLPVEVMHMIGITIL
jgi:hypothetical protein